jgi:nitroreductase
MKRRQMLIGASALVLAGAGAAALSTTQMGSMEDYAAAVAQTRARLAPRPALHDVVRLATLAANGHNTQPWRFRIGRDRIEILPDLARRTPIVDPDDHHLFVSLGCAAENLVLAAAAGGYRGDVRFDPAGDGAVVFAFGSGPQDHSPLTGAITQRQSTRTEYDGRPVGAADLKLLAATSRVAGVDLVLITDRAQMDRVRDIVVAGNSAQMADAAFVRELKSWIRFNPRQALTTNDGLFSAASGNPVIPTWLGEAIFPLFFRAEAENDKYARQLRSSAGIAVFLSERADKDHWVRAGRACQRFALQATALGLKVAFINQPVEIAGLRPELATLVRMPGRRPDIVMRFGYGPALPYSPRRSVPTVLA